MRIMDNDSLIDIILGEKGKTTLVIHQNNKLMLASEIGKKWGCDPNYVRELYRLGLLKGIKFTNKTVKFRREEVEQFEKWAEDKDLSDLTCIKDVRTGLCVTRKVD